MGADFCRHFSAIADLDRQKNCSTQHPTARPSQRARSSKDSLTSKICQNLTIDTLIDDFRFTYTYIMGADISAGAAAISDGFGPKQQPARLRRKTCLHTKFHLDPLRGSRDLVETSVRPSVRTHTTNTIVSFACKAKLTKKTPAFERSSWWPD